MVNIVYTVKNKDLLVPKIALSFLPFVAFFVFFFDEMAGIFCGQIRVAQSLRLFNHS
jgi:hypothetical protein